MPASYCSEDNYHYNESSLFPKDLLMQAPLELVGLGSSSSMDSFASWKINGSGMEKEEREEMPLQGEDESRRSSPP